MKRRGSLLVEYSIVSHLGAERPEMPSGNSTRCRPKRRAKRGERNGGNNGGRPVTLIPPRVRSRASRRVRGKIRPRREPTKVGTWGRIKFANSQGDSSIRNRLYLHSLRTVTSFSFRRVKRQRDSVGFGEEDARGGRGGTGGGRAKGAKSRR